MIKISRQLLFVGMSFLLVSSIVVAFGANNMQVARAAPTADICDLTNTTDATPAGEKPPTPNSSTFCNNQDTGDATSNSFVGPGSLLNEVVSITTMIAAIISVIAIILGGLKFVTSSGDASGVSSAKSTIIYAVVALVVSMVARLIVLAVLDRL